MNPALTQYVADLKKEHEHKESREHAYRPALKKLLETISHLHAINDGARINGVGAPDLVIKQGEMPVAFVEAKDIGVKLDQMKRYLEALNNLILTDYVEFRHYYQGKRVDVARLGRVQGRVIVADDDGLEAVDALLSNFFLRQAPQANSAEELAGYMAGMARQMARLIEEALPDSASLQGQKEAFEQTLIPSLSERQFADMYAQTLAYGLFAARIPYIGKPEDFTLEKAFFRLPPTNPFSQRLFQEIVPRLDDRVKWLAEALAGLLAHAQTDEILEGFGQHDPIVHFYETFLAKYDPVLRERRGVYYTPEPVVSYIVRSVDHILKTRFDRADGLGDDETLILDPATGTGTFLYHVIRHIYETNFIGQAGAWDSYVSGNLLKRMFGFELLMAPYAVAHMKLGAYLERTGYAFNSEERLGVYLTNTLEEVVREGNQLLPFANFITEEGRQASAVKRDKPIMVVLGNPPYSGHSANKGEWITNLVREYYFVDGKPLGERNPKWLQNDYVKFIRFGQWRIDQTGSGVLAFITDNSYLDNVTFRGMRQQLMEVFTDIYILNLHGNSNKREKTPDGGVDQNVFDIQQGVSIAIFVRDADNSSTAQVHIMLMFGGCGTRNIRC